MESSNTWYLSSGPFYLAYCLSSSMVLHVTVLFMTEYYSISWTYNGCFLNTPIYGPRFLSDTLGLPVPSLKPKRKMGGLIPDYSLSFCTRDPDWSFLCNEQESYLNLMGLNKLLLLPPATGYSEFPRPARLQTRRAWPLEKSSQVDLLPPFT